MSNDVNIIAEDIEMNGSIHLYENGFKNGAAYFGKYDRKLVSSRVLYARIQKKNAGTSLHEVQKIVGMLKEVILESIKAGEAVNLMDLMTLYITVNGKIEGKSIESGNKLPLGVKITPSALLKEATKDISIKNIDYASVNMSIERIFNRFTQEYDGTITKCAEVQLEGKRLKLGGEYAGVWLCPADEKRQIASDESLWIKCPRITKNTLKFLSFYVPADVQENARYRILVKTYWKNCSGSLKESKEALSDIVTVMPGE